jgi:hypothetical protein
MRLSRAWHAVTAWYEALGVLKAIEVGVGSIAAAAVAVPLAASGLGHDLAWPFLLLLIALAIALPLWCVRELFSLFGLPVIVQAKTDYAYCLAYQGITVGFDRSAQNQPVQIGLYLYNASNHPLYYKVDEFRVIVEGRTLAEPEFHGERGGILPRITSRIYRYPPLDGAAFPDKCSGSVEFVISYGAIGAPPARTLKMKIRLFLDLKRQEEKIGMADVILEEKETNAGNA